MIFINLDLFSINSSFSILLALYKTLNLWDSIVTVNNKLSKYLILYPSTLHSDVTDLHISEFPVFNNPDYSNSLKFFTC